MTLINQHLGFDQVSAFIDGELPPPEARELEQHLAECHACTLRIVAATQLKAATARAASHFTAPPDAISRLAAQLRSKPPKQTARLYTFRAASRTTPWLAAAAALLIVLSLIGWRQLRTANNLTAELLDQHLAVLSSSSSPQVISSDRHSVKPWFQGKLPFSFNLPDTFPAGATLKGANLTFLHGQPAALLLFTVGKHQASVFLTQRSSSEAAPLLPGPHAGFDIQSTNTHDLRITAVSDVNPADLALLLSALANAQSPR